MPAAGGVPPPPSHAPTQQLHPQLWGPQGQRPGAPLPRAFAGPSLGGSSLPRWAKSAPEEPAFSQRPGFKVGAWVWEARLCSVTNVQGPPLVFKGVCVGALIQSTGIPELAWKSLPDPGAYPWRSLPSVANDCGRWSYV